MGSIRRWRTRSMVAAWLYVPVGTFVARWVVLGVTDAFGNVSAGFALLSLWVTVLATLAILGWMTWQWFAGRNERHVAKVMNLRASRRIVH